MNLKHENTVVSDRDLAAELLLIDCLPSCWLPMADTRYSTPNAFVFSTYYL